MAERAPLLPPERGASARHGVRAREDDTAACRARRPLRRLGDLDRRARGDPRGVRDHGLPVRGRRPALRAGRRSRREHRYALAAWRAPGTPARARDGRVRHGRARAVRDRALRDLPPPERARARRAGALALGPARGHGLRRARRRASSLLGLRGRDGPLRQDRLRRLAPRRDADGPGDLVATSVADDATDGTAVYTEVPGGQDAGSRRSLELLEARAPAAGRAIRAVDLRIGGSVERPTRSYVTVDVARRDLLHRTESRMNLLTRELTETDVAGRRCPPCRISGRSPASCFRSSRSEVLLAERDGTVHRFDLRDAAHPVLAESARRPARRRRAHERRVPDRRSVARRRRRRRIGRGLVPRRAPRLRNDRRTRARARARARAAAGARSPRSRRASAASSSRRATRQGGVWLRHATSEQDAAAPRRRARRAGRGGCALAARRRRPRAGRRARRALARPRAAPGHDARHDLRPRVVRGLSGARLHVAVVVGHGSLRAEAVARAADLRHREGHVLLAALRAPDRARSRRSTLPSSCTRASAPR